MIAAQAFLNYLRLQLEKKLPFVAYRKPSDSRSFTKAFLQKDDNLDPVQDYRESGFVFAPFNDRKQAVLIPSEGSDIIETAADFSEIPEPAEETNIKVSGDTKSAEEHKKLVQQGIDAIKAGEFEKVVLSRKEILGSGDLEAVSLFLKLLKKYDSALVYLWYHPRVGCWLGATPEVLLQVERGRFKTMALAGTQKYEDSLEVNWGKKEKEEQKFVTDSILEDLAEFAEKVETSGPFTARAGSLLHLRTDISGTLNPEKDQRKGFDRNGTKEQKPASPADPGSLKKIISALHPTPAVCGLPKEPAKEFILKKEGYDREFYTGFLGELNVKNERKRSGNRRNQENQAYTSILKTTSLYVNLRCMKLKEGQAELFVGGGITRDSDPQAEWEETKNKAETMRSVL